MSAPSKFGTTAPKPKASALASSGTAAASSGGGDNLEAKMHLLTLDMGFTFAEAERGLDHCGGQVDRAVDWILAQEAKEEGGRDLRPGARPPSLASRREVVPSAAEEAAAAQGKPKAADPVAVHGKPKAMAPPPSEGRGPGSAIDHGDSEEESPRPAGKGWMTMPHPPVREPSFPSEEYEDELRRFAERKRPARQPMAPGSAGAPPAPAAEASASPSAHPRRPSPAPPVPTMPPILRQGRPTAADEPGFASAPTLSTGPPTIPPGFPTAPPVRTRPHAPQSSHPPPSQHMPGVERVPGTATSASTAGVEAGEGNGASVMAPVARAVLAEAEVGMANEEEHGNDSDGGDEDGDGDGGGDGGGMVVVATPAQLVQMMWMKIGMAVLFLAVLGLGLAVGLTLGRRDFSSTNNTASTGQGSPTAPPKPMTPKPMPRRTPRPTPPPTLPQDLAAEICAKLPASCADLEDAASPQSSALEWLTADPASSTYSNVRRLQRFALATLRRSTSGWKVSTGWMSYSAHECDWYGVTCASNAVSAIQLSSNMAGGSIPCEVALLGSSLERLWLVTNNLSGTVPSELGRLSKLKKLYLDDNSLTGSLPTHLGKLENLEILDLSWNKLMSTVPSSLGNLVNLKVLWLYDNNLTGSMPQEVCALREGQLSWLSADCDEVGCGCCTRCCKDGEGCETVES